MSYKLCLHRSRTSYSFDSFLRSLSNVARHQTFHLEGPYCFQWSIRKMFPCVLNSLFEIFLKKITFFLHHCFLRLSQISKFVAKICDRATDRSNKVEGCTFLAKNTRFEDQIVAILDSICKISFFDWLPQKMDAFEGSTF